MTKEKVACIAGTSVDTRMGADLLRKNGYEAYEFPSSKDPTEETLFQISSDDEKNIKMHTIFGKIKELGINKVLVYCNSLSSAVDFKSISESSNLRIVTPFDVYEREAKSFSFLGVIAANSVATSKIEKVFMENNEGIKLISIGMLPLVWDIEGGLAPKEIIVKHKLKELCMWFKDIGAEAVLLGCTHFPYFYNELREVSELPIIDPTIRMLELL